MIKCLKHSIDRRYENGLWVPAVWFMWEHLLDLAIVCRVSLGAFWDANNLTASKDSDVCPSLHGASGS